MRAERSTGGLHARRDWQLGLVHNLEDLGGVERHVISP
jgi:hypothetical protein